jgi:hypothetical protein
VDTAVKEVVLARLAVAGEYLVVEFQRYYRVRPRRARVSMRRVGGECYEIQFVGSPTAIALQRILTARLALSGRICARRTTPTAPTRP